MLFFPLHVDIPISRWPWMNWVLLGLMVVAFGFQLANPDTMDQFILGIDEYYDIEEHPMSWLVHMFLHAGLFHLVGNMVFLWVFGNAVCAKIGNLWYALLFVGIGLLTAVIEPYGLGASGAIYGVIGFTLVYYPFNDVTMAWVFFFRFGTFPIRCFWVVLMYVAGDVLFFSLGDTSVAYLSHTSGCATGVIVAVTLIKTRLVLPVEQEWTVFDVIKGDRQNEKPDPAPIRTDVVAKLYVRMPSGKVKHLPVHEFIRHEQQGKQVNQFEVSEDGQAWTTFGTWRRSR